MGIESRAMVTSDTDRAAEVLGLAFGDFAWTRLVVDERDHDTGAAGPRAGWPRSTVRLPGDVVAIERQLLLGARRRRDEHAQ